MADRTRRPLIAQGQLIRCAAAPTEIPDLKAPEWIHVFPATLFHHPWIGTVDPSVPLLELMVHNNNRYDGDLVVDYNHQSVDDYDAPAAGFVDRMELRANGIWAHVAYWTAQAVEGIESGEWRWISPTWYLAAWSRVDGSWIGPAWHSIALTNTPQIDGLTEVPDREGDDPHPARLFLPAAATADGPSRLFLPPVFPHPPAAASATPTTDPDPGADVILSLALPLLLAALGLDPKFDLNADDADDQLAAAVSERIAEAATPPEPAEPAIPAQLLEALEVPNDTADPTAAAMSAVELLKASAVDPEEHGKLIAQAAKLKAEERVRELNLAPAAVPHARRLALAIREDGDPSHQAFQAFAQVAPRIPASVPTPRATTTPTDDPNAPSAEAVAASLTPTQLEVAKQLKITPLEYAQSLQRKPNRRPSA